MATNRSKFRNIGIPMRDLTDILKGRATVVKDLLPADAEILNVDGYMQPMQGVVVLSVVSEEYPEITVGSREPPIETFGFAYFDQKKQLADAGLEIDVSP